MLSPLPTPGASETCLKPSLHFSAHPLYDLSQAPSCPVPQFLLSDKEKFEEVDSCLNLGDSRDFSLQETSMTGRQLPLSVSTSPPSPAL